MEFRTPSTGGKEYRDKDGKYIEQVSRMPRTTYARRSLD